MKKSLWIASLIFLGLCSSSIAQTKAVVIPMSSNRAYGTDGQVQYNDNGKASGAEVYYDKTTGNVGIGNANPADTLDVNGNINATSFIGDGSKLTNMAPVCTVRHSSTVTPSGNYTSRIALCASDEQVISGGPNYSGWNNSQDCRIYYSTPNLAQNGWQVGWVADTSAGCPSISVYATALCCKWQ